MPFIAVIGNQGQYSNIIVMIIAENWVTTFNKEDLICAEQACSDWQNMAEIQQKPKDTRNLKTNLLQKSSSNSKKSYMTL